VLIGLEICRCILDRKKSGWEHLKKPVRIVLIAAGTFFTGIGLIGVVVPIMPTIPFLLIAAFIFLRSSDRMYSWLIDNRYFGDQLKNYLEKKGLTFKTKMISIIILWSTILFSSFIFIDYWWMRFILMGIATGVTIHLLLIRTLQR